MMRASWEDAIMFEMANDQSIFLPEEEKEFKRYYRWTQRLIRWRPTFRRAGLGLFLLIDICLLLFTLWTYTDFVIIHFFDERAMVGSIVEGLDTYHAISEKHIGIFHDTSPTTA